MEKLDMEAAVMLEYYSPAHLKMIGERIQAGLSLENHLLPIYKISERMSFVQPPENWKIKRSTATNLLLKKCLNRDRGSDMSSEISEVDHSCSLMARRRRFDSHESVSDSVLSSTSSTYLRSSKGDKVVEDVLNDLMNKLSSPPRNGIKSYTNSTMSESQSDSQDDSSSSVWNEAVVVTKNAAEDALNVLEAKISRSPPLVPKTEPTHTDHSSDVDTAASIMKTEIITPRSETVSSDDPNTDAEIGNRSSKPKQHDIVVASKTKGDSDDSSTDETFDPEGMEALKQLALEIFNSKTLVKTEADILKAAVSTISIEIRNDCILLDRISKLQRQYLRMEKQLNELQSQSKGTGSPKENGEKRELGAATPNAKRQKTDYQAAEQPLVVTELNNGKKPGVITTPAKTIQFYVSQPNILQAPSQQQVITSENIRIPLSNTTTTIPSVSTTQRVYTSAEQTIKFVTNGNPVNVKHITSQSENTTYLSQANFVATSSADKPSQKHIIIPSLPSNTSYTVRLQQPQQVYHHQPQQAPRFSQPHIVSNQRYQSQIIYQRPTQQLMHAQPTLYNIQSFPTSRIQAPILVKSLIPNSSNGSKSMLYVGQAAPQFQGSRPIEFRSSIAEQNILRVEPSEFAHQQFTMNGASPNNQVLVPTLNGRQTLPGQRFQLISYHPTEIRK